MSMKIGDLIEYINLDGDRVHGVVCKDVHKHTVGTTLGRQNFDAVEVVWMDDNSITTEFVEDILDPGYTGLVLL